MERTEWLEKKHREMDKLVSEIEDNAGNHDLVRMLKKQKLLLKDEIKAIERRKV